MAQETINTPRETTIQRIATALENILNKIVDTSSASNIDYDNTESGLDADKVQGAIDELASEKADKATTLAGYGITNAYTKAEVNDALNNNVETIAEAIKQWDIGSYTIDLYGIGLPETYYTASSTYSGDKYLDVATGKMYDCLQTGADTYIWRQAPVVLQLKSDINASAIEDLQEDISQSLSATGNPLTIESSESNLVECVAKVECVQEGSGDPSPTNIRPIIGQTEVVIEDVGKNLIKSIENGTWNTQTQAKEKNNQRARVSNIIKVSPSNQYTFNIKTQSGYITYVKIDSYRGLGANTKVASTDWQSVPYTYTTPNNAHFITIEYGFTVPTSNPETFTSEAQFELGSTATAYEPYKGKTYTIQLGDTIYGGELDILTGELRVTHGEVDLGSLSWSYVSSESRFYAQVNGIKVFGYNESANIISSCYRTAPWASSTNGDIFSADGYVSVKDSRYTNANTFKTAVTGQTLVYELAEPYTIQLTPQQIKLLKGTNNISCNTGDLSIKYYPDNVLGQLKGDIESEYDERVETLETQTQELLPSLTFMSRERRNITSDLDRLSTAVAEQNLAKYGYKIGDYFTGASGYTYILADYNTFKGTATPYCITSNHLGIVVDTHKTSQWHSGDASDVGYNGSVLNTFLKGTVLDNIKADFKALFGGSTGLEHLIAHSKLFTTALANWAWQANQYISALTCTQIDAGSQWTANGFQEGEASKSLELFRKYKWTEIFGSEYPWLRNLSNYNGGLYACTAANNGHLHGYASVTDSRFVVGLINFY